jgi:hypothetical protein
VCPRYFSLRRLIVSVGTNGICTAVKAAACCDSGYVRDGVAASRSQHIGIARGLAAMVVAAIDDAGVIQWSAVPMYLHRKPVDFS